MQSTHSFAWWPTLIVLAVATFTDLRSRRIPNWLVLPFMVAGIFVSSWRGGWHGAGQSLAGLGVGAFLYGILFFMGGMGAGDVKLSAAIGAWIGPMQMLMALIITGIVGGVMALGWVLCSSFFVELCRRVGKRMLRVIQRDGSPHSEMEHPNPLKQKMPYGPAIAVGTLLSFFVKI